MPTPAYLDRILTIPHEGPFPAAVIAIACAGYLASVADHWQPTSWDRLTGRERHRWLQAADFLAHLRGLPEAPGIHAVYFAGYAEGRWEFLAPKSRIRWHRVTSAMVAAKAQVTHG